MTAREKFQIGGRVRLSPEGARLRLHRSPEANIGTVVGFPRKEHLVRVKVDRYKLASSYSMNFWEPAPDLPSLGDDLWTVYDNRLRVHPRKKNHEHRAHAAKLTTDQVREIRRRYADREGSFESLAADYGVSNATISQVVHRDTWKRVE